LTQTKKNKPKVLPQQARRKDEPADGSVISLTRGLEMLRAFQAEDAPLGNKDLAELTGLPKPTIARLSYTAVQMGYLKQRQPLGKYTLGDKVSQLGRALLSGLPICAAARPAMQQFADEHNLSVALGSGERTSIIYLEYCSGAESAAMGLRGGAIVPMADTAIGRAYLWGLADGERERLLARIDEHNGDRAAEVRERIAMSFLDLERDGFTISLGDWRRQIYAVGTPLWVDGGKTLLALSCATSKQGSPRALFERVLGPRLLKLAAELAERIAGTRTDFWNENEIK
jgi:DNA-binding IclR family transcriptional regulator